MSQLQAQIDQLKSQLRQLIRQHTLLQKETKRLKQELDKKDKQLAVRAQELAQMQPHLDAARLDTGVLHDNEKKELSRRIDAYLKEIDQCLALLNQ